MKVEENSYNTGHGGVSGIALHRNKASNGNTMIAIGVAPHRNDEIFAIKIHVHVAFTNNCAALVVPPY